MAALAFGASSLSWSLQLAALCCCCKLPICFTDRGDLVTDHDTAAPKMYGSNPLGGESLSAHCETIGHAPGLSTSTSMLRSCLRAQVLCFEACWDASAQEFGDVRRFRVLYFLADGTIEVGHRVPR